MSDHLTSPRQQSVEIKEYMQHRVILEAELGAALCGRHGAVIERSRRSQNIRRTMYDLGDESMMVYPFMPHPMLPAKRRAEVPIDELVAPFSIHLDQDGFERPPVIFVVHIAQPCVITYPLAASRSGILYAQRSRSPLTSYTMFMCNLEQLASHEQTALINMLFEETRLAKEANFKRVDLVDLNRFKRCLTEAIAPVLRVLYAQYNMLCMFLKSRVDGEFKKQLESILRHCSDAWCELQYEHCFVVPHLAILIDFLVDFVEGSQTDSTYKRAIALAREVFDNTDASLQPVTQAVDCAIPTQPDQQQQQKQEIRSIFPKKVKDTAGHILIFHQVVLLYRALLIRLPGMTDKHY